MKLIELSKIRSNKSNPRHISKDKLDKLKNSITEFQAMLQLRPVILDEAKRILGGNMRSKAARELGIKKIPYMTFTRKMADEMNQRASMDNRDEKSYEEYCQEFIIKDNVPFGDWDWDVLESNWEYNYNQLFDWGFDLWMPDDDINLDDFLADETQSRDTKIVLSYSQEVYDKVVEKMNEFEVSKEEVLLKLLKIHD